MRADQIVCPRRIVWRAKNPGMRSGEQAGCWPRNAAGGLGWNGTGNDRGGPLAGRRGGWQAGGGRKRLAIEVGMTLTDGLSEQVIAPFQAGPAGDGGGIRGWVPRLGHACKMWLLDLLGASTVWRRLGEWDMCKGSREPNCSLRRIQNIQNISILGQRRPVYPEYWKRRRLFGKWGRLKLCWYESYFDFEIAHLHQNQQ